MTLPPLNIAFKDILHTLTIIASAFAIAIFLLEHLCSLLPSTSLGCINSKTIFHGKDLMTLILSLEISGFLWKAPYLNSFVTVVRIY